MLRRICKEHEKILTARHIEKEHRRNICFMKYLDESEKEVNRRMINKRIREDIKILRQIGKLWAKVKTISQPDEILGE